MINEAALDPVFVSKVNVALALATSLARYLFPVLLEGLPEHTAGFPDDLRVVRCERCGVFWLASEVYEWRDLRTSADVAAEGPVCECMNCSVALKRTEAERLNKQRGS